MSFVIGPMHLIKGENNYPEYVGILTDLQKSAIARAQQLWTGFTFGGINPGANQFGIAPLRMNEMANDVNANTASGSYTFRRNQAGIGWRTIYNYTTRKDILQALTGFSITDSALLIDQFRFEFGTRKFPVLDVQLAQGWGQFDIVIKQDQGKEIILDPETAVLVNGYYNATGFQRVVPIGFMLYKRADLVINQI